MQAGSKIALLEDPQYQIFSPVSARAKGKESSKSPSPFRIKKATVGFNLLDNAIEQQENLHQYMDVMPRKFDEALVDRNVKLRPKFAIIRVAIQDTKRQLELQRKKLAKMQHDHDNSEVFKGLAASVERAHEHLDMFTALADKVIDKINFRMKNMGKSQEYLSIRKNALKIKMHENFQMTARIRRLKKELVLKSLQKTQTSQVSLVKSVPMSKSLSVLPINKITPRTMKSPTETTIESSRQLIPGKKHLEITVSTSRLLSDVRKGFRSVRNEKDQEISQHVKPVVALHSSRILITEMVDTSQSQSKNTLLSTRFHTQRNSSEGRSSTETQEMKAHMDLNRFIKQNGKLKQRLSADALRFVTMANLFKECLEMYENYLLKTQQASSSVKGLNGSLLFSITILKKKDTLYDGGPTMSTIQNFYKNSRKGIQFQSESEITGILTKTHKRLERSASTPKDISAGLISHLKGEDILEFTPLQLIGVIKVRKELYREFRETFFRKQRVMTNLHQIVNGMKKEAL